MKTARGYQSPPIISRPEMLKLEIKLAWILMLGCFLLPILGCVADESEETIAAEEALSAESTESIDSRTPEGCIVIKRKIMDRIGAGSVDLWPNEGKFRGDILVLPAWGEARDAWCHRSTFCTTAQEMGYRLIFPGMGKSIYTKQHYPETRPDWKEYPTYTWLRDTLIPELQEKYCVLGDKGNNFVVGMSAGARGVIRLLQDRPALFVAGAALSGDYDPGQMKGDNIYRGFLGSFDKFSERWEVDENLSTDVANIQAPLYLGHGKDDPLVPYIQTEQLYASVLAARPELDVRLHLVDEQMDGYEYWNSEIPSVLTFFGDTQANRPETP